MPYRVKIKSLTETHRVLDEEVKRLEMIGADPMRISEIKRRKLMFKDEIARLEKLQFEEDHERINLENR